MSAAVAAAIDKVVDAFAAFVQWAIEFIQDIIDATLAPLIRPIQDAIGSYVAGIMSAAMVIETEYQNNGHVSPGSINRLVDAIFGPLFLIMIGVVAAISVAIIAMKVATMGIGALLSYATSSVESFLITSALGSVLATIAFVSLAPDLAEGLADWVTEFVVGAGGSVSAGSMLAWTIDFACSIMDMAFTGALLTIHGLPTSIISGTWIGLAVGALSIVISTYATASNSLLFEIVGLAMGGYAVFETVHKRGELISFDKIDPSAREILALSGIVSTTAVVVGAGNLINEAYHE
jgi:hypothetical protein